MHLKSNALPAFLPSWKSLYASIIWSISAALMINYPAKADTVRTFQIEIIPFINLDYASGNAVDTTSAPSEDASPSSLINWPERVYRIKESATQAEMESLPIVRASSNPQLTPQFISLKRSRDYRPLNLFAWYDSISADKWGRPVLIGKAPLDSTSISTSQESTTTSEVFPLSGYVRLQRGYYLHLLIDLEFTAESGEKHHIRERRRVNFNDVHYFDSPAFGVLTRVTPYEATQSEEDE